MIAVPAQVEFARVEPSGPTVLVVDDDRMMRLLLRRGLELAGFHVIEAECGHAAVVAARMALPSLILLDYHMPDMDGPAVTRALKSYPTLALVPVIQVTASQEASDIEEAFAAGADDYVTKPVNVRILTTRVRATLQGVEDRKRARRSEELAQDLAEGRKVQAAQLPPLPIHLGPWVFSGAMTACASVGGDLYDVVSAVGGTTAFLVDVSGHGTGAALVAASVSSTLSGLLQSHTLAEAAMALNLCMLAGRSGRYACLGAVQLGNREVSILNAGLPPIAVLRAGARMAEVSASGPPPGLLAADPYEVTVIQVSPGDRVVLLSDGLTEPFGMGDDLGPALRGLGLLGPITENAALRQRLAGMVASQGEAADDATVLVADWEALQ